MPQLVENLNFGAGSGQPIADTFTTIGNTTFFAAWHADAGVELWKTDGTTEGTVLVKDIWPGPASSFLPGSWISAPAVGKVYFRAQVIQGGNTFEDIWCSDGTEAGTTKVTDFPTGGPNLSTLALVGSRLYFTDFTHLYTIDTNTQQVRVVKQFANSVTSRGIAFSGKLYFAADDGQGTELYASDGTSNGTEIVRDINPAVNGSSFPRDFTALGNRLFFSAENGDRGRELWVTDGTPNGTTLVDDINPLGASSNPSWLTALGGTPDGQKLYFSAQNAQKRDLYVYDPATPAVRPLRIDVNPGTAVASDPAEFTYFNGSIYFVASSAASGRELFRLTGTTPTLIDVAPGQASSNPSSLRVASQSLLFAADNVSGDRELYRVTSSGTASLLANIWDGGSSSPVTLASVGSTVFFSADDGLRGRELWKTDGTAVGTVLIRDLYDGHSFDFERRSSEPDAFVNFDGRLFFTASSFNRFGSSGALDNRGLYSVGTDGRHALGQEKARAWAITPPRDLPARAVSMRVYSPTVVGTTLYFSLKYFDVEDRPISGGWLYKLSAGSSAAVEVKRFATTTPQYLQAFKGRLFFSANDNDGASRLWVSGGTGDSTVPFGSAYDPSEMTPFTPSVPSAQGSFMFFQARERENNNYEVWRTDGMDGGVTGRFADLNTAGGSYPGFFTPYQGSLYFTATGKDGNGDYGKELYWTDGFRAPELVRNIDDRPGIGSSPRSLAGFEGYLYFAARNSDHGEELWRTNGTVTERLTDLNPGRNDSSLNHLIVAGNRLFFGATDGRWNEVWSTADGTTVMRATSINPNGSASPHNLSTASGRLYFWADDGLRGRELWELDPATNATRLVADLNFGSGGSEEFSSTVPALFDGKLYFAADDGVAGMELWALPLAVPPTNPTNLTGTTGNSQVSLSWASPSSDGGAAITDYLIQFSSNSGSTWTTFGDGVSTATSATVTGLTNGTSYVFRVAAVNSVGTGLFSATSAAVTPRDLSQPVVDGIDLNGDGQNDLVWIHDSGVVVGWQMKSAFELMESRSLGGTGDWALEAAVDVDGDRVTDLLWRHIPTGSTILWVMRSDGGIASTKAIGGDLDWSIETTGDYDGDGREDIIWRHGPSGINVMWLMNGADIKAAASIGGGADWRLASTSFRFDSDGDGKTDMIWRHSSGANVLWRMNGPSVRSAQGIGGDLAWTLVATGDFDGDGQGDLLWRHSSGVIVSWLMNDGLVKASRAIGGSPEWSVVHTADHNRDGRTDIFWRHSSGLTVVGLMNGLDALAVQGVGGDRNWRLLSRSKTR